MKKIGLVGGISWVSTLDYYKYINEEVNLRLGGLNAAELIIYSLNFADVQKKTWEGAYELLLGACQSLKASGVEAIVLGANTAHLYADELEQAVQLPLISIVSETARYIKLQGLNTVGLLGTKFTMEKDFYRTKLEQLGLQVVVPSLHETREYIQHVVKEELGRGEIKPESKARFIDIANELMQEGAEGIILGCTEIPLLISQVDFVVPVFDTTKIHAAAIVDYMLS
ncbi:aspartate/glutamate racemase family protein [Hymenobacter sp. BT18]|uniref:aspartate/glutamate racemase family protein n=1 Tax=Hymenobacter sp. BT18 TaxID=2835648 RepID=UPI00143EF178|nr:aspartate/glutamate racemase family protein [Hymenobacter sp. BT18]QIX62693.1 aspartate/glutamate racemase family protein [Hymenobacter sp. BT18]